MEELVGSPYYVAPEVLKGNYGAKCDVWSTGVLCYFSLAGSPPFDGEDDVEIMENIKKGNFLFDPSVMATISPQGQDFIKSLLEMDPSKRPSASEAL